ncbi:transposase, partial [Alicyclobacillus contaminans]
RMARKLMTKRGRAIYAKRKVIVEPVYGHIKACMGFVRFSLRGLAKVRGEWSLVAMCHNLLKIFRYGRSKPATV